MRYIIAICAPAAHGKTEVLQATIRDFHFQSEEVLANKYGERGIEADGSFSDRNSRVVVLYRGKRLGFENMDDADRDLRHRIATLADEDCDIILITCGQSREVRSELLDAAERNDAKLITIGNFYHYNPHQFFAKTPSRDDALTELINEASAQSLHNLIDRLVMDF